LKAKKRGGGVKASAFAATPVQLESIRQVNAILMNRLKFIAWRAFKA